MNWVRAKNPSKFKGQIPIEEDIELKRRRKAREDGIIIMGKM